VEQTIHNYFVDYDADTLINVDFQTVKKEIPDYGLYCLIQCAKICQYKEKSKLKPLDLEVSFRSF
jgi:hypothetical protein